MREIIGFMAAIFWIAGVIIAKGFWSTFFALIFPFWSWYLIVELTMQKLGLI